MTNTTDQYDHNALFAV